MKTNSRVGTNFITAVGAAAVLTLGAATQVHAACGKIAPDATNQPSGGLIQAVYHPSAFAGGDFTLVSDWEEGASIVGLWKFEWLSDGKSKVGPPAGTLLDFGLQAWHPDGTEIINSGNQNPVDGNFCLGAWRKVGQHTYKVKHIPLAYSGGHYVGPVLVTETITISPSGNSFTGRVTLTPFLATNTPGHEFDETTPLVPEPITGTITATRVTAEN